MDLKGHKAVMSEVHSHKAKGTVGKAHSPASPSSSKDQARRDVRDMDAVGRVIRPTKRRSDDASSETSTKGLSERAIWRQETQHITSKVTWNDGQLPVNPKSGKPVHLVTGFADVRGRSQLICCETTKERRGKETRYFGTGRPRICDDFPRPCRFGDGCKFFHSVDQVPARKKRR